VTKTTDETTAIPPVLSNDDDRTATVVGCGYFQFLRAGYMPVCTLGMRLILIG
jgi:hypothetical protein